MNQVQFVNKRIQSELQVSQESQIPVWDPYVEAEYCPRIVDISGCDVRKASLTACCQIFIDSLKWKVIFSQVTETGENDRFDRCVGWRLDFLPARD